MTNALQVFDFNENAVRVIMKDDQPWFVAKDVCEILDIADAHTALRGLDSDEKDRQNLPTPGGEQDMSVINESGLYTLIMRSNKPEAKKFRKWVTSEVLPAIRKTGHYEIPKSQTHTSMVEAAKTLRRTVDKADCGLTKKEKRNINRKIVSMLSGIDIGEVYAAEDLAAEWGVSISTIKDNAFGLGWYDKGVLYFKQDGRDKLFEKLNAKPKKKKKREVIEEWEEEPKYPPDEPYVRPKRAWEI